MEKSAIDRLREAKKANETALVCYFNNGKVRKDENYMVKHMEGINDKEEFDAIMEIFCNATDSYSRHYDFDDIKMGLELGLIFRAEDLQDGCIKTDAQPVKDIVRYYTGSVNCYSNGKQSNDFDYGHIGRGRQNFVSFNGLISAIKKSGLQYTGPETFEEFEEQILVGEPFEISMSANLGQKGSADTVKPQRVR